MRISGSVMRAADTNVIVRLLMRDEPQQFEQVMTMLQHESVYATPTVLLETEWVLRSAYRLSPRDIQQAFRHLLGLPEIHVEAAAAIARAVQWFEAGMDFADALHLATAEDRTGIATFDRDFIKIAARLNAGPVTEP